MKNRDENYIRTMTFFIHGIARSILLAILFFSGSVNLNAVNNQDHGEWAEFVDNQMTGLMSRYELPNASVAVVAEGEIILLEGYGFADMEAQAPVDPRNNLFRTGSVSKIFTWTAIMQLAEKGLLDLDKDIAGYLDFPLPDKLSGKKWDDPVSPITMRHLLSHTAGFEDVVDGLFRLRLADHLSLRDYLIKYMPARIFPAGSVMAYSNYGTALAGYIVERISGLPFGEYMDKQIFSPLGMENSSFRQPLHIDMDNKLVGAYRKVNGEFKKGSFEYMPAPAGGMSTTAENMALFMLEHLAPYNDNNGSNDIEENHHDEINPLWADGQARETAAATYKSPEGKILSDKVIRLMHSSLFSHHPLLGGMAHGFKESSINGQKVLFHAGSSTLFDAGFYLLPEEGAGLFFCYSGGMYTGHVEVFHAFMQRFFPATTIEFNIDDLPGALARKSFDEIKGEYQGSRRNETGPDKLLNLFSSVMRVSLEPKEELEVDLRVTRSAKEIFNEPQERGIIINLLGSGYLFKELQPGIFKNMDAPANYPFGPLQYLVADTDPYGRLMLVSDGPMTFIRMPLHATSVFTAALAGFPLLLILTTLFFSMLKGSVILFRRKVHAIEDCGGIARYVMILHAILTVIMLIPLAVTGSPHPVYQLPLSAFGYTSVMTRLLEILPTGLSLLAISMVIFCLFAWLRKFWSPWIRIHYSLYTISAVALAWLFWFYNLLIV